MIKLCIFDLDGTVLDTVGTIAYYGNFALKKNGIEPIEAHHYKYFAGTGISNLIKNMLNYRQCLSDELYEKVFSDYDRAYNADVTYNSSIFDGLLPALDTLKEMGVMLAITSNKPDYAARKVVEKIYGKDYFCYVAGQTDRFPLKPNPAMINHVLDIYGASPEECVYVGDTSTDMAAGKNAGIFTVGVLWGFRDREELLKSGADVIIDKPSMLCDIVSNLSK